MKGDMGTQILLLIQPIKILLLLTTQHLRFQDVWALCPPCWCGLVVEWMCHTQKGDLGGQGLCLMYFQVNNYK